MKNINIKPPTGEKLEIYIVLILVIWLAASALISLIKVIAVVGGVGYILYFLKRMEDESGAVSNYFITAFNLPPKELPIPKEDLNLLGTGEDENLELKEIKSKLDLLEIENYQLQKNTENKIHEALRLHGAEIAKKKGKEILNNIFDVKSSSLSPSEVFERKEYTEKKKKKIQELEIRELKHEVNAQLFEQKKETLEVRMEGREDRGKIRMEMNDGFSKFGELLIQLDNKIIMQRNYFIEKAFEIKDMVIKGFSDVGNRISDLENRTEREFANVSKEFSGLKLSVGEKFMKVERDRLQVLNKLNDYQTQVKQFSLQAKQLKMESERYQIRGQRVLDQAQILYQKHRVEMSNMGKDLEVGLEKVSLHKSDFALKAGQAKLQLDKISQDQYLELKNIGYAELGVTMLRQDFTQREELKQREMQNLIAEKKRTEERVKEYHSRGLETAQLRHRINMLDEKYQYANHTNSIMQREHNVFKRLSNS